MFDTQVRDWLIMGAINKDDAVEQLRSDNGDSLSRFNDEQMKRNVRGTAKDVDKDGSCEQSMIFVIVHANVITVSSTAPGLGNVDDDDEDDDSTNLLPATATPSKKKGRFSDEEGQTDLLENSNKSKHDVAACHAPAQGA